MTFEELKCKALNGTLLRQSTKALERRYRHIYYVKNKGTASLVRDDRTYEKMKRRYADVIAEGIVDSPLSVKSDKVWICWFQGEDNAPDLVKACINSMRKYGEERNKEIIILSDKNISDYVQLPDYITKKREKGNISAAHYSDLLRLELLCTYGGVWADATVLCTSGNMFDCISALPLFVYKRMDYATSIVCSNWLISACSNQKILLLVRRLLHLYWRGAKEIDNYFLFHIFFSLAARRYAEDFERIPLFNNGSPHTLGRELSKPFHEERWNQIVKMADFHKLNHHIDYTRTKDSYYQHIISQYL